MSGHLGCLVPPSMTLRDGCLEPWGEQARSVARGQRLVNPLPGEPGPALLGDERLVHMRGK